MQRKQLDQSAQPEQARSRAGNSDAATIAFTSIALPQPISQRLTTLQNALENQREKALAATPAFIVNHSSNIIGGMDILAEMMILKATGSNLVSPQNRGKPLHYIIDPPINLYRSVAARASFDSFKELLDPRYYRQHFKDFTNLEKASQRDLKASSRGRLINRWQARAMFCSLLGMTASALIPQGKDDPNETQQMGQLFADSPARYAATRFKQALWVPGWGQHTTQFTGLAKTITGGLSFLSSYRNVAEGKRYFRNPYHGIAALITTAGGMQLMLGVDKEQSWKSYGATSWLRIGLLPASIGKRFYERDKRAWWYAGGSGLFQLENTFAYMVGGAEKDEHGNVIDKKSVREQAAKPLFAPEEPETPRCAINTQNAVAVRAEKIPHSHEIAA